MTGSWMRWARNVGCCIVAVAALGCGGRADPGASGSSEQVEMAYGSLHMPLVTPEQDGFRLQSALFEITRSGDAVLTLDSESDPDALALDAELAQGSYEIQLRDGWALERQGAAGGLVSAALLTANPLGFEVTNARVTELIYGFATEQGTVTFGKGGASVSVSVTPTAPSADCSVLDRSSCADGQTCLLAGDTESTYCAQPGSLPVGAACSSEQCVAGAQCLSLDPSHPEQQVCARFCSPASSFCACQGITVDPSVGLCTQATSGSLFSHDFPGDITSACNAWNSFRSELVSSTFARVTVGGSRASNGVLECAEPGAATQICRALRSNAQVSVGCQGHNWSVSDCGGGPELSVDSSCGCNLPGNTVRPCNGMNFGGVGTDTCSGIAQTIEVSCEGGSGPLPVSCGNGVIEGSEVCDTNGAGVDVLPAGAPLGSTCNVLCAAIIPPPIDTGVCLSCAVSKCSRHFDEALGVSSSAANREEVAQLLRCIFGSDSDIGGPIPLTSCFFADPNQPLGSLVPCYCGNTPVQTCLVTGPANPLEACGQEIEDASDCNPVTATCVASSGSNPDTPLADAVQLLNCERAACAAECGFPWDIGFD